MSDICGVMLAKKWRPKNFSQVVGQQSVVQSLKQRFLGNNMPQAILFAGPHGVGKTTLAKVVAMCLRCVDSEISLRPCGQCSECKSIQKDANMDVLEIDGASYNSVEDVREIVESLPYMPSSGHAKIFIIDEVHMLSRGAFNALLKSLEAPPAHVYFIFATTHPDKIPLTILSRLFRYNLSPIRPSDVLDQLVMICKEEKIRYESKEILEKIVLKTKGHMRDALNTLDQMLGLLPSHDPVLTMPIVYQSLGLIQDEAIEFLLVFIFLGDTKNISSTFAQFNELQVDLPAMASSLLEILYKVITQESYYTRVVGKSQNPQLFLAKDELFWLYEGLCQDMTWAIGSLHLAKTLEIIFLKYALRRDFFSLKSGAPSVTHKDVTPSSPVEIPEVNPQEIPQIESQQEEQAAERQLPPWEAFVEFVQEKSDKLYVNMEQGNILEDVHFNEYGDLVIEIAFPWNGKIFSQFMKSTEASGGYHLLVQLACEFYQIGTDRLQIRIIDLNQEDSKNFCTRVEQKERDRKKTMEDRRNTFVNDKGILALEKIFNTKIEQIIVKETDS